MRALRKSWRVLEGWMLGVYARNAVETGLRADDRRRRMTRSEVAASLVYLAALLISHAWLLHLSDAVARAVVAMLPWPPIAWLVALAVRRVSALDELERRIELVALAVVAVSAWLGLVTCWLLQRAGMPLPSPLLGFCALGALHGLARRWARRHYA